MEHKRLASALVAATMTTGSAITMSAALAAPAHADVCVYKVRHVKPGYHLNVRSEDGRVIDKLYRNRRTVGKCGLYSLHHKKKRYGDHDNHGHDTYDRNNYGNDHDAYADHDNDAYADHGHDNYGNDNGHDNYGNDNGHDNGHDNDAYADHGKRANDGWADNKWANDWANVGLNEDGWGRKGDDHARENGDDHGRSHGRAYDNYSDDNDAYADNGHDNGDDNGRDHDAYADHDNDHGNGRDQDHGHDNGDDHGRDNYGNDHDNYADHGNDHGRSHGDDADHYGNDHDNYADHGNDNGRDHDAYADHDNGHDNYGNDHGRDHGDDADHYEGRQDDGGYGDWRKVVGHLKGHVGYSHKHYLQKTSRLSW